jgi:hypothetical protein
MYIDITVSAGTLSVSTNDPSIDTRTIAVTSVTKVVKRHGNKLAIFYTPDGIHSKIWAIFDYRQVRTPSSASILALINTLRGYVE